MNLADALDNTKPGPGNVCRVSLLRRTLSDEDRETFDAALDDEWMQTSRIHAALLALGYEIAAEALRRHRRRLCKCER